MDDTTAPAAWIDGHPQLEAIAAAVWEQCRTEETSLVVDDPRTIAVAALAALLPAADQAALHRIAEAVLSAVEAALGDTLLPAAREEALAGIVTVLPSPADRATELLTLADAYLTATHTARHDVIGEGGSCAGCALRDQLRRMADETPAAEVEHCVHDRAVHTRHHHQPVTGCPWCATAEEQQDGADHVCNSVMARGHMDEPLGYYICGMCGTRKGGAQP